MLGTPLGGRYKIITELGVGGFGQTYLAEDTQQPDSFQCVVKQFKPIGQDINFLEVARRLFDTEIETLRRLGQHDQIPQLFDFFEENREFYLVQEFIDGQPLSQEFHVKRLGEVEVIALLQDVLNVLEFVHHSRVIHRDIKPSNLIRRHRDGKIVLIDFGAVKEISTQLLSGSGQTGFTVGIGTYGYTPTEQLAGKPRFCSDIYALGITAIQALTGLQPSQLPEDPDTSEIIWQECVHISPGLAFILDRMTRFHFNQRYQTATEVLQALQRMSELPTDITTVPPSLLLPEVLRQPTLAEEPDDWRSRVRKGLGVVAIAAVAVTGLLLGIRQIGWLEPLELAAFDQMVRSRADAAPDPRLLVVAITETDLQTLQRSTPSDQAVADVLAELAQHQPSVIGLDLHRDLPQEPGHAELLEQFQSPNVITIMKLGTTPETRTPPPATVPEERIGFSDFPIDDDRVVRRNLMFASTEEGVFYSFSLRLALKYLASRGITPSDNSDNPDVVQIGEAVFPPLEANSGEYQGVDAAGYQVLLSYRSTDVARQVSFVEVLNGQIDPSWVRDKIVLIGTTAPSGKDLFYTPYSAGQQTDHQMPGVVVHAEMVSQILSAVLDEQPIFWFWSEWVEVLWIAGWAGVGGSLVWSLRHPVTLGMGSVTMLVVLAGAGLLIFTRQGWVPIAAPAIALVAAGGVVMVYQTYQVQRQ